MILAKKEMDYRDRKEIEKLLTSIYIDLSASKEKIIDNELYSGKLGLVLYYFYYSQIQNKTTQEDIQLLDEILDDITTLDITSLDDIFLFFHVGLVIQTLLNEDPSKFSQYESLLSDLDILLFPYMEYYMENSNFEFLRGSTIMALYYSLRKNEKYVSIYIGSLYKKIDDYIHNHENLNYGIAHGISGIILYLVNFPLIDQRNETLKIKRICEKCINHLLNTNHPPEDAVSYFKRDKNACNYDTKLGWCQGDLSIGYMMLKVYMQFPDILPIEKLNYILKRTLRRSDREKTTDFCLCHGATGISLFYYLQYREKAIDTHFSMYTYWLERAIELYQSGERNPIYKDYGLGLGLLLGEIGLGLYLMLLLNRNRNKWTKLLMLK